MIRLLSLPVVALTAGARRYLQHYAPSNVLIRRVQVSRPLLSSVAGLLALTGLLLVAAKVASNAGQAGVLGWLNLAVLVLVWDSMKVGAVAGMQFDAWVRTAWACRCS